MTESVDVMILGAGISGCTAAHFLRRSWRILEERDHPGGLSTQYSSGPYWFDYGGHYFHFLRAREIQPHLMSTTPFRRYQRRARVWLFQRMLPYPVQANLDLLPRPLPHRITAEMQGRGKAAARTLGEQLRSEFGPTLFRLFFHPFLSKYYRCDLESLVPGMEKGSIPPPGIKTAQTATETAPQRGYNAEFFYPARGLRHFWDRYSTSLSAGILTGERVTAVDARERIVETEGSSFRYRRLINTIPLPQLLSMLKGFPDAATVAASLRHTTTQVTNLVLASRRRRFNWVYLPDPTTPYYRMGYYPGTSPCRAYLEQTLPRGRNATAGENRRLTVCLQRLGVIREPGEIRHVSNRIIPVSYVLFDRAWKRLVPPLLRELREQGIYSIGRYGGWNYSSMAADALTAMRTAGTLNAASA